MNVHLRTFGCRANQYDSETVRAMLAAAGASVVDEAADADVAVFNSCAVTAEAEADLRKAVRRAARERPALRTVIMGCASALPRAATDPARLDALPGVEALVPGADMLALARALDLPPDAAAAVAAVQRGARALLRVQDGCDEHCTFCATTIARGANRSRPMATLLDEAERLAERHAELVLTGVHIGTYGRDAGTSLGALLEALVHRVPHARFRLSSVEATEVDARLAALLRDAAGHVCPYLHAPLQSGSDRLLRRMGRHWYTADAYAASVERLVDGRAVFGLGADVIAGFPGETEDDHAATLALVERLPFAALHVFPYSPRPGTAATRLPDPVAPAVAQRRAGELRALARAKGDAYAASRVGGAADVVVIGEGARRSGMTEDYLTVTLADASRPRGARAPARLALLDGRLTAVAVA
ncbi:MiaB/RimO family radical SAM methylthiotransferase [Roseisolibacter agri]|uniref:tRNA (N(6)-L-threonylcarbamoyladenosine(37)-C(2))-methylthiotransferase MtaB n=1 Tax=Roseisolibacter agri TaxID=2014610 RepID=A0AA37QA34_9BACT|nr:MiaB/RimO family radical SAM methylthiotransferase [Roseisolibacter agri]GLC26507.1 tRNA (N(6)-L-threonylcarbamoyladenosine(37)-C(2))-methylthiotransferase MtaB [Roseisolibacter agri]